MSRINITAEMKEALTAFESTYLKKLDDAEKTSIITDLNDIFEMFYEADYLNMYKLMLATGLRCGEACALKRSDIDFSSKKLTVQRTLTMERTGGSYTVSIPKSRKFRTIPLSDLAIEAIRSQLALRTELFGSADAFQDNYLFFSPKCGEMALRNSVLKDCKRICKAAGIEDIGTHSFRTTFINVLLRAKTPIEVVAEIAGHSSIQITYQYYNSCDMTTKLNAVENAISRIAI